MGYNLTKSTVRRQLPQLQQLEDARKTIYFPSSNPERLAYKLREALAAAAAHPEEFPALSSLKPLYRIRTLDDAVLAEWISADAEKVEGVVLGTPAEGSSAENRGARRPVRKTLPEIKDPVDLLSAAITFKEEPELYFPNVRLTEEEKKKIASWAGGTAWKFIDHEDGGATLTRHEVPDELVYSS